MNANEEDISYDIMVSTANNIIIISPGLTVVDHADSSIHDLPEQFYTGLRLTHFFYGNHIAKTSSSDLSITILFQKKDIK